MSTTNKAYINGKIVAWARKLNNIPYDQLEKSLNVNKEQIIAWEAGQTLPTFNQAIELADALHIPFGFLFLSDTPDDNIPLPDLRTRASSRRRKPSGNFLELLYQVVNKQEWYKEYLTENGGKPLPFVSKFSLRDSVATVAADIRQTLHIDADLRRNVGNRDKYLSALAANAEDIGITVLRSSVVGNNNNRKLDADEFQGFAIADDIAPFVFVNTDDFKTAQIFTLAHELAHIWVGKSGVTNTDEEGISVESEQRVETFCNEVAVETLVPAADFLRSWDARTFTPTIDSLANEYRVSTFVILRRAHELNKIETPEFKRLLEVERAHIQKSKSKSGPANYWVTVATRHSQRFMDAVLNDVQRGGTVWRDGARLLSVQVPTLMRYTERPG